MAKVDKKLVDVAITRVMDLCKSNEDTKARIKFYRNVATELQELAAAMAYEFSEDEF